MIGRVFDKLTVVEDLGSVGGHRMALCRCDCGRTKKVRQANLRNGSTRSCGCLARSFHRTVAAETGRRWGESSENNNEKAMTHVETESEQAC